MYADRRRGSVLLMALLVMSGVLIVSASLGTISVLSLRQAKVIDDAVIAFGAAESGAEQTLYQIRRVGTPTGTLDTPPNNTDKPAPPSTVFTGVPMGNGSKWTRKLTSGEPTVYATIPKDKSYEVVLWNPDFPGTAAGVESMTFAWDDDCGGTSGLEVLTAGWVPSGSGGFNPIVAFHGDSPALTFLHSSTQVVDTDFTLLKAYRVRLRAKTCNISNLRINTYDGDVPATSNPLTIPSQIAVASTGIFGTASQGMELKLPRLQPLSGAFDFVIFSQCSLLKGVTSIPCP